MWNVEEEEEGDDVLSSIREGSDIPPADIHNIDDVGGQLALGEDVVFGSRDLYDDEVGSISSCNNEHHPPNHIPSHNKNYQVSQQYPSCISKSVPPPSLEVVRQKASRDNNASPTNV